MDAPDTTHIRLALNQLHIDFDRGRDMLFSAILSRLRQLIRIHRRDFPLLVGQSDNTESLVLEKLNRALEKGHRPESALHFWNLSAKITRHVLIDLVRAQKRSSSTISLEPQIFERGLPISSDSHDPSQIAVLTELHELIDQVAARLRPIEREILTLRFYTELPFSDLAELLGISLDKARYHWRLIRLELATSWSKYSLPTIDLDDRERRF